MASLSDIKSKIILSETKVDTKNVHAETGKTFEQYLKDIRVDIKYKTDEEIQFDLIGVDASIANAYRRIMLAEVPIMAIEKVYMMNNTSVMPDDVLAHRMGLIPIKADPRLFNFPAYNEKNQLIVDSNSVLEFELSIKCSHNKAASVGATLPEEKYKNSNVYTRHMKWVPIGDQAQLLGEVKTCQDDILIMKLRPGQEIKMKLHCVKGVGKDHAKFSPVATATYRLLPSIKLLEPITGELARKLQSCFAEGVIGLKTVNNIDVAFVLDARKDTATREVCRHKELKDLVELSRISDHFIFTVESIGVLPAIDIVKESIKILMEKCDYFIGEIAKQT
ncbi:DNA-directed RNA polymerases I and III subunit RPAC1 isoform X1 [Oopsacas minuta]|uniref:DNA-directed RNA polymerases I and III subunit RPAC1 n=1 Tax=Oopsacas minuta TaxID=111878 RepID=A0AAV7JUJ9_9METZ|nr:DNA-directed RNA polymerases I and III subunit RPAC1 isoform X1 [Oopsacas minuta]